MSGTVSAGSGYPANGETVSVTINGLTQNATIAGGAGGFSVSFPTATIPPSSTAYTITYSYAGNAAGANTLNAAANNTSTALTVNGIMAPNLTYTNAPGVARIITLAEIESAGLVSSQTSPIYSITVGATSAGGTVMTNSSGTMIRYSTSSSFAPVSDSFNYTISDGTATATATVTIDLVSVAGPQITPSGTDGSGHPMINFRGIPGYSYHFQRSTDMSSWTTLQPGVTVPSNGDGSATWTDNQNDPVPNPVFYRLSYP